jgi:anti-sigma factor (TIGR02949 family)
LRHKDKLNEADFCLDRDKCIQVLHLIIDGEASDEDEVYFYDHINQCIHCSQYYRLEQTIRVALRKKMKKKIAPENFINEIRNKFKDSIKS